MKTGIVTLYYGNRNYGGNLQAYALCRVLNDMGHEAKVVSYCNNSRAHYILSSVKQYVLSLKNDTSRKIKTRKKALKTFNESIPHTKLYFPETISKVNKYFDCFIVGSDQVWNPDWINVYNSLGFVEDGKRKISYADSIGKTILTDSQLDILKKVLDRMDRISIREKENLTLLKGVTDKSIEVALDPTLLFDREEWDEIASDRMIADEYIFCYFLRDDKKLREIAREYASSKGLKIVTLPYLNERFGECDKDFGDHRLFNVSPKDFISLVKYSSFVITDSFHAAVFSHVFGREFIVSSKKGNEMGCRLKSLTELFGTENRYLNDHDLLTPEYLNNLEKIPFVIKKEKYSELKERSLTFLKEAIGNDR